MNGGCTNCDNKNRTNILDRDRIIKTAHENAKKEGIEYAIYQEAGEWRTIRIDLALKDGIYFEQVISQHSQY